MYWLCVGRKFLDFDLAKEFAYQLATELNKKIKIMIINNFTEIPQYEGRVGNGGEYGKMIEEIKPKK